MFNSPLEKIPMKKTYFLLLFLKYSSIFTKFKTRMSLFFKKTEKI